MTNPLDSFIKTKNLSTEPLSLVVPECKVPLEQNFSNQATSYILPLTASALEACKMSFQNNDLCHQCNGEGDLLMCDSCPKTYHKHCLTNPNESIAQHWFCEACRGVIESTSCNICHKLLSQTAADSVTCSLCDD